MKNIEIPCSYQGGKSRLAKQIVDIFFEENKTDENTKFYDLCCGSGSVSIELMNRGIHPNNIIMIDKGCFGAFWQSIANDEFDLKEFRRQIDLLPKLDGIQKYLQELSEKAVDENLMIYHYLLLQAGAFGSKQIWIENGRWKNNSFRSYWLPTETSNRRSPVNPMMPMPETLYNRVEGIVNTASGCITAINDYIENHWHLFDQEESSNAIVYIDPPYKNTTKYGFDFDPYEAVLQIWNNVPIYISEGYEMCHSEKSWLLSKGRNKGNISGNQTKKPTEEWLNRFK